MSQQLEHGNLLQLKRIADPGFCRDAVQYADDGMKHVFTGRTRHSTWGLSGSKKDRRRTRNTMGMVVDMMSSQ
jgi:hypothetical protein